MKRLRRVSAVMAAFGLAFALIFTGCPTDGDNNGGGGILNLSGQVYTRTYTYNDVGATLTFVPFLGTPQVVSSNLGGSGTISAGGILDFSIGRPDSSHMGRLVDLFSGEGAMINLGGATFSDDSTMATALSLGTATMGMGRIYECRENGALNERIMVFHIFVDRDVTVSHAFHGSEPFSLAFRNGWNAIRLVEEVTRTETDVFHTVTMSVGDLGYPVRWVMYYR